MLKRLVLPGIAFLLIAIVVQFPAGNLAPAVARATGERWRLASAEGTVWQGRARLYALDRATGNWQAGPAVRWHVLWRSLASGAFAARLEFDDGGHADVMATAGGWSLKSLDATAPAGFLAVLLPSTLGEYGWQGTLTARSESFGCRWGRRLCAGTVDATWQQAATRQIAGPPLGDYALRVTGEGDAVRFKVSTIGGRLQVSGGGEISRDALQFTGEASITGEDVRLDSLLRAIGRPASAPGRYMIEYREKAAAR